MQHELPLTPRETARADQDGAPSSSADRARSTVVTAVVAVVALAAGLALGLLGAGALLRAPVPGDSSVDAGFARDMQAHHAQAVEMSVLVRDRTDDEEVRVLALDILLTQQQQQGQMFGWLATWGLPQASTDPVMAWMADHHDGPLDEGLGLAAMPGYASAEQLERLTSAQGQEAERLYLALMIPHHQGGVDMADVAAEQAEQPAVRALAAAMVAAQRSEIAVLRQMLDERGGAPDDL
ncbi:DUF305 domain-containing protein [Actinotalea sp. K2]|uniref:DUF305 domain-containing protein n=1 Tax=Actinotalea sp. K2 TaxID=2939438 RepID=UPI00201733C7|nr:DUF305 domain-containing protein [Actinotalea sp. K2]MCL3862401.1 DUF305 domain-containing protein [Actinotalea sp. K2]